MLDGDLFGEPLVLGNDVFVATENDTVYALSVFERHRHLVDTRGHSGRTRRNSLAATSIRWSE